jgi:hypothetical protein
VPSEELFPRLIKHRTTRQRHVENFLTEVLAEFLNVAVKAEPGLHLRFIREVLLADCKSVDLLGQIEAARHTLVWKTQHMIDWEKSKRPLDLVLFDKPDGRPLLVVENKVNAPIGKATESSDESEQDDDEGPNQLSEYGGWLSSKNPNAGLVLLTYATRELPDFKNEDYGVKTCAVSLWVQAAEWLLDDRIKTHHPIVQYLRKQLRAFLESEGIVQIERKDIDLLGQFFTMRLGLGQENRLDDAEGTLTEILNSTRRRLKGRAPRYDYGALLCYRPASEESGISLGWGFTSARNLQWFPHNEGRGLVACVVALLDDDEKLLLVNDLNKQLKTWGKEGYNDSSYPSWYTTCSANALLKDTHGFTKAFENWVEEKIDQAERLAQVVAKRFSSAKARKRRTLAPKV